jgi:predicted NUDIX family phosphoesterase
MEQILVVERNKLLEGKQLLYGFHNQNLEELLKNIHRFGYFIDRPDAENNPSLKQIIPYLLISHKNDISDEHKLFLVQRLATQTEKRLHNKYSIGIGGHINPVVTAKSNLLPVEDIIKSGLERELHEELEVSTPYQYKLIGYLNDDTNSVGQVHLGLVFQVTVNDEDGIKVAEKDLMVGKFVNIKEIEQHFSLLESWSQIVYKDYIKSLI